jgi:Ca2+-binding EF-hand superfamily protein
VFSQINNHYKDFIMKLLITANATEINEEQADTDGWNVKRRDDLKHEDWAEILQEFSQGYVGVLNSIRDLFNLFDEDHSGQLNVKELALLHQEVTGKKVKENLNQLKNDIDADGSGEISIEEYAQWLLNGKVPLAQTSIKNSSN